MVNKSRGAESKQPQADTQKSLLSSLIHQLALQCWSASDISLNLCGWQPLWWTTHRRSHQSPYLASGLAMEISYDDGRRGGQHRFAQRLLLAGRLGAAAAAALLLRCWSRQVPGRGCCRLRLGFGEGHRPLLLR